MEQVIALLLGANIVTTIVIWKKLNNLESKKDPYEKYRNEDGLLRRKVNK